MFPPVMMGKGDVVRLHPRFIQRCLYPTITPETKRRLIELRGRIEYIKIPEHTRTAFAYIQWMEKGPDGTYHNSAITSPWLNLCNVELVNQETLQPSTVL